MGRKALSTGYLTEEQQEVLADLDDALADYSNVTTEEVIAWDNYKNTHPGGSLEEAWSGFKKARAELRDKKEEGQ